jgi:uncharacterized protein (TIGR03435 family)
MPPAHRIQYGRERWIEEFARPAETFPPPQTGFVPCSPYSSNEGNFSKLARDKLNVFGVDAYMILTMRMLSLVFSSALAYAAGFEVATIKPAAPQEPGHTSVHRSSDEHRLQYTNVSLLEMIAVAHEVQTFQVVGPDWLADARFDVAAKLPEGSTGKETPAMLRAMLAERFHMATHEDKREMSAFALTVAPGGIKASKTEKDDGTNTRSNNSKVHLEAKTSMARFARYLSNQLKRPVLDRTALTDAYAIVLDWQNEGAQQQDGPSLFTALQEQAGLKLTSTRAEAPVIVVDKMDRTPTEN